MSGDKLYNALASTVLMNEVCSTLNIPLEILGFTDTVTSKAVPMMFIFKAFNDLKVSTDKLEEYFAKASVCMRGNPDGENILWAYQRLLQRKEKNRLLIVMSDGDPAATKKSWGLYEFTHKVIREIEQQNKVNLYGLGILHDAVKKLYKNNSVVNNTADIPTKLLSLIERKIVNHVGI
jgi:cobalamin biosynthesis protein CobT